MAPTEHDKQDKELKQVIVLKLNSEGERVTLTQLDDACGGEKLLVFEGQKKVDRNLLDEALGKLHIAAISTRNKLYEHLESSPRNYQLQPPVLPITFDERKKRPSALPVLAAIAVVIIVFGGLAFWSIRKHPSTTPIVPAPPPAVVLPATPKIPALGQTAVKKPTVPPLVKPVAPPTAPPLPTPTSSTAPQAPPPDAIPVVPKLAPVETDPEIARLRAEIAAALAELNAANSQKDQNEKLKATLIAQLADTQKKLREAKATAEAIKPVAAPPTKTAPKVVVPVQAPKPKPKELEGGIAKIVDRPGPHECKIVPVKGEDKVAIICGKEKKTP